MLSGDLLEKGIPLKQAKKALIMLHGRGASSGDIMSISTYLSPDDFYMVAPQAANNSWYPYSFLTPVIKNEPWLTNSLEIVLRLTDDIIKTGLKSDQIFFLGFSQGACLALEFTARNARKWGGIIAFSGGLIGETLDQDLYRGDLKGTSVFIGNSDTDPHIPVQRCRDSAQILKDIGAKVKLEIYPGMGHTISTTEIDEANLILSSS